MAVKYMALTRALAVTNGAGGTAITPALMENVNGVDTPVAPDIVIAVPKATGSPMAVITALGTGALTLRNGGGAPANADVLALRLHTKQRVLAGLVEKYAFQSLALAIANGAGTAVTPALVQGGVAQIPDIVYAVPKAIPAAATGSPFIAAALTSGAVTIQHEEVAPVSMDVLALRVFQGFRMNVTAPVASSVTDKRYYFTILNTAAVSAGAVYQERATPTNTFVIERTKVAADGSLQLNACILTGVAPAATGTLDLVSGTGDAAVAYTARKWEKLLDIQQNVAVPNGGTGLVFDPGLVVEGVPVMPDIVIPIPKATGTVPFVPTDLAGAVGTVAVLINGGAPVACDILSIRLHSEQRVGTVA